MDEKENVNGEINEEEVEDAKIIEEKKEIEIVEEGDHDSLKNVAHSILEKGKKAGDFSFHYFKDLGRFAYNHEKMIKEIFDYSNNTHILLTLIHGLILGLLPLLIGMKLQMMMWGSKVPFGQVWGMFSRAALTIFLLSVIFQWAFALLICMIEGIVEHHKVSLIKSLKAINVMQMVWTPFVILTGILLFLPLGQLGIYISLLTLIVGLLFASIILIKTVFMSRIVSGKSIMSLFSYALFIALLVIGFVYLSGTLISDLLFGILKTLFLFG